MNSLRIYEAIVSRAKERVLSVGEKHHVQPRAMGGTNDASNIVMLTYKEHFLAHWLLWRIYRSPAMARAFTLMVRSGARPRGAAYAAAKEAYASSMRGKNNIACTEGVREKLRAISGARHPGFGKKRPVHAEKMRALYKDGTLALNGFRREQNGANNASAVRVRLWHGTWGVKVFETCKDAAVFLGVSLAAVSAARKRGGTCVRWAVEAA